MAQFYVGELKIALPKGTRREINWYRSSWLTGQVVPDHADDDAY